MRSPGVFRCVRFGPKKIATAVVSSARRLPPPRGLRFELSYFYRGLPVERHPETGFRPTGHFVIPASGSHQRRMARWHLAVLSRLPNPPQWAGRS
jgi:hypothetical protein